MYKLLKPLIISTTFSLLVVFFSFCAKSAYALESITSFHSELFINQDTSLTITEQINYTTTQHKHGIYRYIPIRYNAEGQVERLNIYNISVRDELGDPIQFERTTNNQFVTLKIGDPDTTFIGEQIYIIEYTVERALTLHDTHAELYWDITGEGWQFPIETSSAEITSPHAPIERADCFTGTVGSDDELCSFQFSGDTAQFVYEQSVAYGSNFTIALSFPRESGLQFPTESQLFFYWIRDNWTLFLLPFPLVWMLIWWMRKGRDIEFISPNVFDMDTTQPTRLRPLQFGAREPLVYEPLKDLSPGEAGGILNEHVEIQDVVAEILELARKKYLKIDLSEEKSFFKKVRSYSFTKLPGSSEKLTDVQQFLFDKIFETGDVVKLEKLKGSFYTEMNTAKSKIEAALVEKKLFTSHPTARRVTGIMVSVVLHGVVFFLVQYQLFPLGIYWPLLILIPSFIVGFALGYNMTQKTAVGSNLWLQARGLKKTIARGKWREEIKEKHLFIEEILPFAVALGVVDKLAKDMEELQIEPPSYINSATITGWSMSQFVSGFSTEVGNTLSYNPSSSSSGGSGFSGGFSGGGGGGGGGGSW